MLKEAGVTTRFWFASITRCKFVVLPILPEHTARLPTLPFPSGRKNPFDRLIIAQALVEQISLVSFASFIASAAFVAFVAPAR
jgi:PIN domain nuclease of toxin-antitoxin system